jgi:AcrR family transcriptional regulator
MRFQRAVTLLWGDDAAPVGRTGLTVADFVAAATTVLDEGGAAGLSMRAVASRLDVRAMAAYNFGHKDDLVALVVDRVHQDMYPPDGRPRSSDWRLGLTDIARANRELGLAHPWLPELQAVRSLMGPCELAKRDCELAPLESTPLTDVEKDRILTQVLLHVTGTTRIETALKRERAETGLDDQQWWRAVMPTLEPIVDPRRYSLAIRVGLAAKDDRDGEFWGAEAFQFGLDRLLDGIGVLIAGRR